MTFGILPTSPATGYGYIRPGSDLSATPGVKAIDAFVEKPDAATAARYVADGYLWNSGNFLFKASVFLDEVRRSPPRSPVRLLPPSKAPSAISTSCGLIRRLSQKPSRSRSIMP